MPKSRITAWGLAALLACVLAAPLAAETDPGASKTVEWSVAPLLPAQSLFVVTIKDKQKSFERLQQTGLWKLVTDPGVQDAFKGGLTVLKGRIAAAEQKLGYKLNEVLDLFQGEVTIGMCGFLDARNDKGEPIPDLVIAFQPRDKAQAWMDHWGKIVDLLNAATQNTLEINQRSVAGADIVTLSHPAVPFQISYTLHDGVFMATLGGARIENILAAREVMKNRAGAKAEGEPVMLADHPKFVRAMEKGGKDADALVFVNFDELRKRPESNFGPKTDRERQEWEAAGLNGIHSLAYTLQIKEKGLSETFFADSPAAERTGFMKLLDGPALSADCFNQAPRNTVVALALQAQPDQLFDRILTIASATNPNARAEAAAALDEASKKIGSDIRKDLMASLAGDAILSVAVPEKHPKLGFGFPNVILSMGLKDAGKVRTALEGFRRSGTDKFEFGEVMHGANVIMGAKEKRPAEGKEPGVFCWTVAGDRLLVSMYPLALRDELDRLATGGSPGGGGRADLAGSLSDDGDFRAVRANVPGGSQFLAYVDFAAVSTAAYDFFIPVGQLKQKSPPWVDINRLPTAGVLVKNLGGTLIDIASDADGIRLESFSSTGVFSTLIPAVAAIGEYRKNHAGQEQFVAHEPELAPDVVGKRQVLRDIGTALNAYARGHGGAYPNSLVDLIPKELKEENKDALFEIAYQGKQDKSFKVVAYPTGIKGAMPILLQDGSVRVIQSGQLDGILQNGFTGEKAKPYENEAAKPPLPPPDF
ncbi:MAG: hypothetical protein KIS92_20435 [Planctomycetota bacterium]|nr:hypothetical protein [Planctomycetota bacterium]